MVFMEDSERAARIARGEGIDAGLHVNFTQPFTGKVPYSFLVESQQSISRYLISNKYAPAFYNPRLRKFFKSVYVAQAEEFLRLYKRSPSHINGHHHMHLCANVILSGIIPKRQKIRRNFSFSAGEKNLFNRMYRRLVDLWLSRRYSLTDYFFALSHVIQNDSLERVVRLSRLTTVELMAHPANPKESDFLMSDRFSKKLKGVEMGSYLAL